MSLLLLSDIATTVDGCTHIHTGVAKLLLDYGANINTHSNEFKESALTLACYKGHLEMVKFLLNAGTCMSVCSLLLVCIIDRWQLIF